MARSPFPIAWPPSVKRVRHRESSLFDKSRGFSSACKGAVHQLELMRGISHIVVTSNLPTRANGLPYSAGPGQISDPGIAVWWVKGGVEHALACDRWHTCVENMRAIEKTLEALRGIARWGTAEMVEHAFAGFAALPAGSGVESGVVPIPVEETWRDVFGLNGAQWTSLSAMDQLAIVKARHRSMMKEAHPDHGGAVAQAARLNAALQTAEWELMT